MTHELEVLWQRFSLTKDEEDEVDLGSSMNQNSMQKHCLAGRILTDRPFNLKALSNVLTNA